MSWFSISCREGIRACPLKPWDGRTCGRVRRSLDSRVQGMVLALSRCPAFRVQGFLSSRNQLHSWPTSILQHCRDSWQVSLKFNALYCQIRLTLSGLHPFACNRATLGMRGDDERDATWPGKLPSHDVLPYSLAVELFKPPLLIQPAPRLKLMQVVIQWNQSQMLTRDPWINQRQYEST